MGKLHMKSLVEGGLTLSHWEQFVAHFQDTLDLLHDVPAETKANAMQWIRGTRDAFNPPTQEEVDAFHASKPKLPARKFPFA